ncbi:UNVERIFIED_CONTAM: hypothetical protein Sangu_0771300 [Sesamum angustifolium]|uniref:Immediate early response 3-interacting protein 1 n=1 Tax=Sesamum angustifolium TaxID=2727405 RepID=A0AAW2PTR3_9LAMI
MMQEMGLWTLLEGCLLLANALAILNEERFLAPRGWSFQEFSGVKRNSFKGQILGLIYATQYLRVPLILLNLLCIVVKYACSTSQIILDQLMNLSLDISRGWALREEVSVKKCGEDSFKLSRSNLNLSRRIIYS